MIGIGIDAVEIDRFRTVLARTPGVAERLFTADELAYAAGFRDPAPRLAARFAAKEATMKALSVGLGAFAFQEVEVVRAESGAPALRLSGQAAALATAQGVRLFRISLTHSVTMAEAVVAALE